MPCATPPITWPSAIIGLTRRPASSAMTLHSKRGDADQHILRIDLAANAEAAADMPFEKMNRRRAAPKHARDLVPVPMRHLGGTVQFEHVAGADGDVDAFLRQRQGDALADGQASLVDHQATFFPPRGNSGGGRPFF